VITDEPALTPFNNPDVEFIVATDVVPLFHVPPGVASLKVVDEFEQMVAEPVMGAGNGLTVTVVDEAQPVLKVYVMTLVPAATPETTPDDMVAIFVDALFQVPPEVASFNVVVEFTHTLVVPVITAGKGLTVIVTGLRELVHFVVGL
jgi:hypothetical protein